MRNALALSVVSGVLLHLGSISWYWASNLWVLGLVVFVPGFALLWFSIIFSVYTLSKKKTLRSLLPLALNLGFLIGFVFIPYTSYVLQADFWFKKPRMDANRTTCANRKAGF